jgi:hypothetical protein
MRRRTDRQKDFEAIQNNLYAAGVATVNAAKAHEEMFTTTLEALAEAYENLTFNSLGPREAEAPTALTAIIEALLGDQQIALDEQDYEAYVAAETKLQHLDELAVTRLERQVRLLKAQQQLRDLKQVQTAASTPAWTEPALKAQYKTLKAVKAAFNIKARSWVEAVEQVNQG